MECTWSVRSIPPRYPPSHYHPLTSSLLTSWHYIGSHSCDHFSLSNLVNRSFRLPLHLSLSSLLSYLLLPPLSLTILLLISLPISHFPHLSLFTSLSSFLAPSPPLSLSPTPPSHSSQESDAQAVSTEVGQLDLLEAGPAEDGSEQAEQVRLFLAGEHNIMQKVFAGQEEEERGTQVEIEVRAKKLKAIVHRQSCRGDLGILVGLTDANVW